MKSKLSLLVFTLIILSCSKDDPQPLANKTFSIGSNGTVVSAPTGLASSSDTYAQIAYSYVALANSMTAYSALMKVPSGAKKETSKITAINGRAYGTTETYTWSEPNYGTIGLQITDTGDSYKFEYFFKMTGSSDWLKYLDGEEKKDGSHGVLKVLDYFGLLGDDQSAVLFTYEWTTSGDNFNFKMIDSSGDFNLNMTINTKTKAGIVDYSEGGSLLYHMTWDTNGHGTWKFYDDDGVTVLDEGTW